MRSFLSIVSVLFSVLFPSLVFDGSPSLVDPDEGKVALTGQRATAQKMGEIFLTAPYVEVSAVVVQAIVGENVDPTSVVGGLRPVFVRSSMAAGKFKFEIYEKSTVWEKTLVKASFLDGQVQEHRPNGETLQYLSDFPNGPRNIKYDSFDEFCQTRWFMASWVGIPDDNKVYGEDEPRPNNFIKTLRGYLEEEDCKQMPDAMEAGQLCSVFTLDRVDGETGVPHTQNYFYVSKATNLPVRWDTLEVGSILRSRHYDIKVYPQVPPGFSWRFDPPAVVQK